MKNKSKIQAVIAGLILFVNVAAAHAGVPLNNVEGVGGIAFNPLAYTAGTPFDKTEKTESGFSIKDVVAKPQFGFWRIRLNDVKADWTTVGVATTFLDRLEVSYGNETIAQNGADNIHKNNVGLKGLLLKENAFDTKWVPAVAVGTIYKDTSYHTTGDVKDHGFDYYAVATKLIPDVLTRPVLISGGIRSTDARSTGVYGFGTKRKLAGFGNIDVILPGNVAVGFEYEQGAGVKGWKNANYYDAHVAWLANKNLTLVAAYVNTGDSKHNGVADHKIGLGDGFVLSAQYAF